MPFESQPYAPPVLYDPRHGADRMTELMLRQGDIAAHGAAAQGDIWGNVVGQLGQQAGGYLQQRHEEKRQEIIGGAINQTLQQWDGQDSLSLMKQLSTIPGLSPEAAVKIANGTTGMVKLAQAPEKMDWEAFHHVVGGAADLIQNGGLPALQSQWGTLKPALAKYADALGQKLPDEATPEVAAMIKGYDQRFSKKGGSDDAKPGSEAWYIATKYGDKPTPEQVLEGKAAFSAAGRAPEKSLSQITAEAQAHAQGADVEGRQIRAEERRTATQAQQAEVKAKADEEKAQAKARTIRDENDKEVASAFAAMDKALQNLEKYSGTAAVTSPLKAKFARDQYEASTKAFAATLSRATGDTRISDSDRRAYAGLVSYTGPGSGLLNILAPELARQQFEEAKGFFKEASKARGASTPAGGGSGDPKDPMGIR